MSTTILQILGVSILVIFAFGILLLSAYGGVAPLEEEISEYADDIQAKLDAIESYPLDVVIIHRYKRLETSPGRSASYLSQVWLQSSREEITGAVKTAHEYEKHGAGHRRTGETHSLEAQKYE